jgi:hypothetical protein
VQFKERKWFELQLTTISTEQHDTMNSSIVGESRQVEWSRWGLGE